MMMIQTTRNTTTKTTTKTTIKSIPKTIFFLLIFGFFVIGSFICEEDNTHTDIQTLRMVQCENMIIIWISSEPSIFKESALGRFFHRVAMSVYISIYLHSVYMSPFHVIFLRGRTGVDHHSSKNWCGASATHGALKTRGGCRASIAHASILLHAWSPKNEGWMQSVHRPRVHWPRVHLITRVEP